jgi:hypothetical protein
MKCLNCIIIFLVLLAGCGGNSKILDSKYTYTVALNGIVYGFTSEDVPVENIKVQLGVGERVVSLHVERDGDIGCSVNECKGPSGRTFFSIQNIKQEEEIAVKINEDTYYKCIRIRKLK